MSRPASTEGVDGLLLLSACADVQREDEPSVQHHVATTNHSVVSSTAESVWGARDDNTPGSPFPKGLRQAALPAGRTPNRVALGAQLKGHEDSTPPSAAAKAPVLDGGAEERQAVAHEAATSLGAPEQVGERRATSPQQQRGVVVMA